MNKTDFHDSNSRQGPERLQQQCRDGGGDTSAEAPPTCGATAVHVIPRGGVREVQRVL